MSVYLPQRDILEIDALQDQNIVFQKSSMHRQRSVFIAIYRKVVDAHQADARGDAKPGRVWCETDILFREDRIMH